MLEISSFQLETIETFHPEIAVVLNVTPDHLDRHRSFDAYVQAKARIFENQLRRTSPCSTPMTPPVQAWLAALGHKCFGSAAKRSPARRVHARRQYLFPRREGPQREIMPVCDIPLKGVAQSGKCAGCRVRRRIVGCDPEQIRHAVRDFKAVEHRLEFVTTIHGVDYYNDSKATNVDATIKALESFPANIHLILGGKDKGSDYSVLKDLLRQRVKRVYTIGAAAAKIESQIALKIAGPKVVHAETLENAIRKANAAAEPGDVVLLAPACASFDQFRNYEHRGQTFKEIVRALATR